MTEIHRVRHEFNYIFIRITMQSSRWIYAARMWPIRFKDEIIGFKECRQFQDGDVGTEFVTIIPKKFKPNPMKMTSTGYMPSRKYRT